jgi:lipoprotein-anchoring transpeptidase ErfK/SrfK
VVLAAALAGCGHADEPVVQAEGTLIEAATTTTTTTAVPDATTVVTTPAPSVQVFAHPDDPTPALTVDKPAPGLQAPDDPLAFVVDDHQAGWVKVQLPIRPNGSTGWIKDEGLTRSSTNLRIEVSLSWYRLKVYDGDQLKLDVPVAIGADASPTPTGTYFTTTLIQGYPQPSPYGLAAIGLSAFSEVLQSFSGGPPQIAIHGTYDDATIGSKVSNGCIHLSNDDISKLAALLNPHVGVPVTIAN